MRTRHVETYQQGTEWWAVTTHTDGYFLEAGPTETEALANLADALVDELAAARSVISRLVMTWRAWARAYESPYHEID